MNIKVEGEGCTSIRPDMVPCQTVGENTATIINNFKTFMLNMTLIIIYIPTGGI